MLRMWIPILRDIRAGYLHLSLHLLSTVVWQSDVCDHKGGTMLSVPHSMQPSRAVTFVSNDIESIVAILHINGRDCKNYSCNQQSCIVLYVSHSAIIFLVYMMVLTGLCNNNEIIKSSAIWLVISNSRSALPRVARNVVQNRKYCLQESISGFWNLLNCCTISCLGSCSHLLQYSFCVLVFSYTPQALPSE